MKRSFSRQGHFETEISFIIKRKGEDIAKDIAGLTSILGYDLRHQPTQRINDTYYDTMKGKLRKKRIALRIRRIKGKSLVSVKSNPRFTNGGAVRRIELELPWSRQSLARVGAALGIRFTNVNTFTRHSPSELFARVGLGVIQQRVNRRIVRDITPIDSSGKNPIGELDIDNVTFLGDLKIRTFAVEIEARPSRPLKEIQRVANALESNYVDYLLRWPYGKLVTGLAIRKLLKSGRLEKFVGHNGLKPDAFPLIESTIESGEFQGG